MAQAVPLRPVVPARVRDRQEAAVEAQKRSFLRMVSHELRTPLNSILGFSEILASELYGPLGAPQYKEYAEIIHGSGQKLLRLVNQVLEIARLEGRTVDFECRGESLDGAFDDVLLALDADLNARSVTVTITGRGELPCVLADARGLKSILLNLLHNAIAFSPRGAEVRVSAAARQDDVEIRIEDDGEGVEPADIARLMGPFEQGENALTRRSEGAGLGLPIVDLTAQAMGGRLKITSRSGHGLTASVRLPAA